MPADSAEGPEAYVELAGSHRDLPAVTEPLVDVDPDQMVSLTVIVRRRAELPGEVIYGQHKLTREAIASQYGADPADVERVAAFANQNNLQVTETHLGSRRIQLQGSAADMQRAFEVRLRTVEGSTLRLREGPIRIPADLQNVVSGVFGLDNRPQARPHVVLVEDAEAAKPGLVPADLTATDLTTLYGFPGGVDGNGQTIAIIELGGGYRQSDLNSYFSGLGFATPSVTTAPPVDGGTNNPGHDTNADSEVALDIEVAGGSAPGVKIVVYFAPNNDNSFIHAASTAVHDTVNKPTIMSISWGGAESSWTAQGMNNMDQVFADAAALGIAVFVAAGDSGSSDGVADGLAHVDFPASSPHATGCGGTHIDTHGHSITNEVVCRLEQWRLG